MSVQVDARAPRGVPWHWQVRAEEVEAAYGCDTLARPGDDRLLRAVDVAAPPEAVFAWLGNLRLAPYSYDWLDNLGRRSPRALRSDLPPLAAGQRVMTIFTVDDVVPGSELTIRLHPGPARALFGEVLVTYAVRRRASGSRLIAVLRLGQGRGGMLSRARRYALAWGDLLMMAKQLRTLAGLAEGAGEAARAPRPYPQQ